MLLNVFHYLTECVAASSITVGINIHKGKSTCTNQITLDGKNLEDVKTFTYLGSIIDEHGGSDAYVEAQIGKPRAAYQQLKNMWNSKQLSTNTKVRIFNTNVKAVLLYVAETWRTTKIIIQKIQVIINSCLCKILRIRWQTLSATGYCEREQTRSQWRKKSGRGTGSE
ncbi:Laminin subunit gamma-1 [Schistosoma haematobium]|uniref:Laminin subunit gamma-1 n=1 Tax=Schistosoma haematobium TaxID=6185 RepID=A0A922S846_SCHHA|nr:Laminin subunit gamma-1 [Schistosoma haematobium]KAH9596853.1 Laminin subunit gamma-1 [Schistosoma haematobium]